MYTAQVVLNASDFMINMQLGSSPLYQTIYIHSVNSTDFVKYMTDKNLL